MNNIFKFEDTTVEILLLDGNPLFNPYDVGKCLGMAERTVRDHVSNMNKKQVILLKNSDVYSTHTQNPDGGLTAIRKLNNAGENFLTESGLYRLIFKSRKPEAEKFTDWVTDEVLPTLRKTGKYEINPKAKQISSLCHKHFENPTWNEWSRQINRYLEAIQAQFNLTSTNAVLARLYAMFADMYGFTIEQIRTERIRRELKANNIGQAETVKMMSALRYIHSERPTRERFEELIDCVIDEYQISLELQDLLLVATQKPKMMLAGNIDSV